MAYFSWTDDMSVGNRFIDADHRNLIDIINRLHDAMQAQKADEILNRVLFDLIVYTKGHFRREEQQMRLIGYPGLEAHRGEHALLLKKVDTQYRQVKQGKTNMSIEVAQFLRSWLLNHILCSDMALSEAIAKAAERDQRVREAEREILSYVPARS